MRETAQRRLAAVWFADLVGYTTLAAEDEDAALDLVEFPSAGDGVRSALALPVELARRRERGGRDSRTVRLGVLQPAPLPAVTGGD